MDNQEQVLDALTADEKKPTQTAPTEGSAAAGQGQSTQVPDDPDKELELLDRQAREALGVVKDDKETAEHWRSQYKAVDGAHRMTTRQLTMLQERLKGMGLVVQFGEKQADLAPAKDYKAPDDKSEAVIGSLYATLSEDDKALATSAPDKFARIIAERLLEQTRRPTPTVEHYTLTDSEVARVVDSLKAEKNKDGTPAYPDFDDLKRYMDAILEDPRTPDEFRRMMLSDEKSAKWGMSMLYGAAHQRAGAYIARMKEVAALKERKRQEAASAVPLAGGAPRGSVPGSRAAQAASEAEEIAKAKPNW